MQEAVSQASVGHFAKPEQYFRNLHADVTASLITACADVALVMDADGVICDLAFGNADLLKHGYQNWVGKRWTDTVTVESRSKVEALLRDAEAGAPQHWRHVNHPSSNGADLALSYSVLPLHPPGKRVRKSHAIALGRDLRASVVMQQRLVSAQVSMERDYWRLRHVETRYRLLFQLATEAILIVDASSGKLEEANPAATTLLGETIRRPGWTLIDGLAPESVAATKALLERVRAGGKSETLHVALRDDQGTRTLGVSLFRQENAIHLMVRFTPFENPAPAQSSGSQMLAQVMERAPDGFVVTDPDGRILTANHAFLDQVQIASEAMLRNESLERWLGRSSVDLSVLISNLRQNGTVRLFATTIRGEYGSASDVEISAVSVTDADPPCLGFTIRDVGRRLGNDTRANRELPRSAGQMTELVGRVPLRDIVRETTDLIEQLCIEAALELTNDNRASAAEMLGLSRQSLYVKLRRFGVTDAVSEGER